jgi:hypothetical protein
VPHAPLGGIALMRDPDLCLQILETIVLHHVLGIADYLENHKIPGMREHERTPVAQGSIVALIEPDAVLIDEFIFDIPLRHIRETVLVGETLEHIVLNSHEVADDVRRLDFQSQILPIGDGFNPALVIGCEIGSDAVILDVGFSIGVEKGDLKDIVFS